MPECMVDVVIATFNHENYIAQCLDSVLMQQTNFSYRIIIGDDCSTDGTQKIIRKYSLNNPGKIVPYYRERNTFKDLKRNGVLLLEAADSKYIALLDGDDYWIDPQKLQKQINFLEQNPGAVMCFTNISVFDEDARETKPYWAKPIDRPYTVKDLVRDNIAPTCSVVFKNHLVKFPELAMDMLPAGDWPLYTLLLLHGYAQYLDFVSAVYRMRAGSVASKDTVITHLKKKKQVHEFFFSQPELAAYKELNDAYYLNLYAIAVRLDKDNKERKQFLKMIIKGLRMDNIMLPVKAAIRMVV